MEILINRLLKDQDILIVADELLKKWSQGELSYEDKNDVGIFLINAGLHTTLKNQILQDLSQNREINWQVLCRLVQKYAKSFNEEFVNPIMIGLLETDRINEVLKTGDFIKLHTRFDTLFEKLVSEKSKALGINFLQFKNILKAKEIEALFQGEKINPQEKQKFINAFIENAKKSPSTAYDLAIALTQMDEPKSALECLSFAPESDAKAWLHLELLVESGKFIEALDKSFEIENNFSHQPDTILETLVVRAKAYYGLNEKEKAHSILKVISETYPKYQKAKVLLEQWSIG